MVHLPGGPLIDNMLTCVNKNTQKRVCFSEQGSDLSRSEIRLRKGCNSKTMYFRDMCPFENPLFTHVNIGFNISDPPPGVHLYDSMEKVG